MARELAAVPVTGTAEAGCVDQYGRRPHSRGCGHANWLVFSSDARFGIPAWSRRVGVGLLAGSAETTSGRSGRVSSGFWTWLSIVIGVAVVSGERGTKRLTYFPEKYIGTGDGWYYRRIVSNGHSEDS